MKKIKQFILDWVWQLPQNICGVFYKNYTDSIIAKINDSDPYYKIYLKRSPGSVSLGKYLFIQQTYSSQTNTILHEKGHSIQSKYLGPLYLLVIGIPSILWCISYKYLFPNKSYYWFYTESWANKLAGLKVDSLGRLYKKK